MIPERRREVEGILQSALEHAPGERAGFLDRACGADAALRREVESLLEADDGATGFIEPVAAVRAAPKDAHLEARLRAGLASRYTIERELGRGGMATVYLATDVRHDRPVALKVLHPELTEALGPEQRFLQEIRTTARLEHPHLLPVLDSGDAHGLLWYTMPYVEGESLRARLARERRLSIEEAVRLAREIADALECAHAHGVIHRDIKPENVLLSGGHARVADFGIAKAFKVAAGERVTVTGMLVGTPAYMSPEQGAGERELDARSDIYSLGCVLYEMITGEPPWTGPNPLAVIAQRYAENPRPVGRSRSGVPPWLEVTINKAMARSPGDRFQTAGEFARALTGVLSPQESAPLAARRPLRFTAGAALAGVGLLLAAYIALRPPGTPREPSLLRSGALGERGRVLLADLGARQVDSSLGGTLTELLRIDLAQSPAVTLVSSLQVAEVLGRMRKPVGGRLDPMLAREIAVREGIEAVVTGEVARAGSQYVISAQLISAASGDVLAAHRVSVSDSGQLITAVDRLSSRLRARIGESLPSLERAPPLDRVSTGSLAALRLYTSAGRAGDYDGDPRRAAALLREAIALDSGFAMAYRSLGIYYRNQGEMGKALEALGGALARRERLSERELYVALGDYHSILFESAEAIAAYRSLLGRQPNNLEALNNQGLAYYELRQHAQAEALFLRATQVDSFWVPAQNNLIVTQFERGQWPTAQASYVRARRLLPDDPNIAVVGMLIAARGGEYDTAAVRSEEFRARYGGDPAWRAVADTTLAELAAIHGRLSEADRHWRAAMEASADAGSPASHLSHAITRALVASQVSKDPSPALDDVTEALQNHPFDSLRPIDRPYLSLAHLEAVKSRPVRARALLTEYERAVDPRLRRRARAQLHLVRGRIAAAEGRFQEAIDWYRQAALYGLSRSFGLPELGRGYDAVGLVDSAIAVYQRYLDTPDISRGVPDAVYLASVYRRLGELYESQGNTARSRDAYARFIELWRECDPDLRPQVEEVRRRLSAIGE